MKARGAITAATAVGPRVLLVHPADARRRWLAANFAESGFAVSACDDGDEGLRRIANEHFDLVITAILMPRRDGLELLRAIRGRGSRPPVIAIAGHSDVERAFLRCARAHGAALTFSLPAAAAPLLEGARGVLQDYWNGCSD